MRPATSSASPCARHPCCFAAGQLLAELRPPGKVADLFAHRGLRPLQRDFRRGGDGALIHGDPRIPALPRELDLLSGDLAPGVLRLHGARLLKFQHGAAGGTRRSQDQAVTSRLQLPFQQRRLVRRATREHGQHDEDRNRPQV